MNDEVPTTWPQLREQSVKRPGAARDTFLYFYQGLKTSGPENPMSGPEAMRAVEALVKSTLLENPETAKVLTTMILPRAEQVADPEFPVGKQDWRNNLATIAICNLANGTADPATSADPEVCVERLLGMDMLDERERMQVGWAALGQGILAGLPQFLPFDPVRHYAEDAPFGTNEERIFSHLFRAVAADNPVESAAAAWQAWLPIFPMKFAQEMASWCELLWSARAVHCVIGGNPADTLIDWLRSEIP